MHLVSVKPGLIPDSAPSVHVAKEFTPAEPAASEPVPIKAESTVVADAVIAVNLLSWTYWKSQFTLLWLKQFIAGGVAGGVSRTVTSPLERMKILFQIQATGEQHYRGVWQTLRKVWELEGWRGAFRGNGTNVVRIVPYSAIQFAAYEQYKRMLMEPGKTQLDSPRRLLAGAMAGVTSVTFTYPLDIIRTRLSVQSSVIGSNTKDAAKKLPGIAETGALMIRTEGGWRSLFRGLGPTLFVRRD
jgi:solute carrier family 25 phosphate transporter 23/24/25/41